MIKRLGVAISCLGISVSAGALASDQENIQQQQVQEKVQQQEQVYGWQLMTPEEREQHRAKMRSFKTEEEREQYRLEHHKEMQERARERGVTIPDMPPESLGKGMGPGGGYGYGGGGGGRSR